MQWHMQACRESNAAGTSAFGALDREAALRSLLRVPFLVDLGDAANWGRVFEPAHGSLADFLEAQGPEVLVRDGVACSLLVSLFEVDARLPSSLG